MTKLPTTPGSIVRATIFGNPNQLAALTADIFDPGDNRFWTPLDENMVGERYVSSADLKEPELVFDAGSKRTVADSDTAFELGRVRGYDEAIQDIFRYWQNHAV